MGGALGQCCGCQGGGDTRAGLGEARGASDGRSKRGKAVWRCPVGKLVSWASTRLTHRRGSGLPQGPSPPAVPGHHRHRGVPGGGGRLRGQPLPPRCGPTDGLTTLSWKNGQVASNPWLFTTLSPMQTQAELPLDLPLSALVMNHRCGTLCM